MRFCKYCGTQISETDSNCPNCGKELGSVAAGDAQEKTIVLHSDDITRKPGKYFKRLMGAAFIVVCIVIVAVAVNSGKCKVSGCGNKVVSGSDYCYSHKCAVSSCNNNRISYSNYCYSHYLLYDDDADTYTYTNRVYSYELRISNITLSSNSSYTIAEGTITNNSDQTVSFVEIKGSFKSSYGTVVDTDWAYAVGSEGLAPGESCKWRMSVSKDSSIKDCTVTILDFDY